MAKGTRGGRPSKGTPKDGRLAANQAAKPKTMADMPMKPPSHPPMPMPGMAK